MLLRLLALFCGPRVTDFVHFHAKLDRLQTELDVVLDGIQRGIITLEDFGDE